MRKPIGLWYWIIRPLKRTHFPLKLKTKKKQFVGSSTETVAFQVYEILKIDHECLQIF